MHDMFDRSRLCSQSLFIPSAYGRSDICGPLDEVDVDISTRPSPDCIDVFNSSRAWSS